MFTTSNQLIIASFPKSSNEKEKDAHHRASFSVLFKILKLFKTLHIH